MTKRFFLYLALMALAGAQDAWAGPKPPSTAKLSRDITAHWRQNWPDQQVAHVALLSEQCAAGEVELKGRRGKPAKAKTCQLAVDVYIARGYRYLIYRATEAHYQGARLVSVQLGALEKKWKSGGVPAPSPEQATALLTGLAATSLGSQPEVRLIEMGKPRPYGETYRLTLLVDVAYTADNQAARKERVLATLESDGGDWRPIPGLTF
jgi:hypothetical protein